MKSLSIFLILLALTGGTPVQAASEDDLFAQAAVAYDAGDFAEATKLYSSILSAGKVAPELFFNLGNAAFKQGNLGQAVLNYRRAWALSPRDSEVSANLRFAIQQANASEPDTSLLTHFLSRLSLNEWAFISILTYWLAAVLSAGTMLSHRKLPHLRNAAIAAFIVAAVSVAGLVYWRQFDQHPEVVVIAEGQQALFAPIPDSTPHFALPAGSLVRVDERSGIWIRVQQGKATGWLRKSACEEVYAWKFKPGA